MGTPAPPEGFPAELVKIRPKKLRWREYDYGVSNPGLFAVSDRRLERMRPDLYGWRGWFAQRWYGLGSGFSLRDYIREHLWLGSLQAAVVVSIDPGRVAAYSDMLDCVAILGYNPLFLQEFGLQEGDRLLSVNFYSTGAKDADIVYGPGKCSTWTGFDPLIADFLTDDRERLADRKASLDPKFWNRTWELAREHMKSRPNVWRSGKPKAPVAKE
jgi:hypothetical protein